MKDRVLINGFLLAHTPLKYRKNGAEYMYPYNRKFTFCIIRDPIERQLSMFRHIERDLKRHINYSGRILNLTPEKLKDSSRNWLLPQRDFYDGADFVFLFEDLGLFSKIFPRNLSKLNSDEVKDKIILEPRALEHFKKLYSIDFKLYEDLVEQKMIAYNCK